MDSSKARFILQSWRASGADEGDPHFEEALRQLDNDPELAAWFEQELALDRAIVGKLRQVPVPETLPEIILAGREFDPAGSSAPRSHGRSPVLAMAALFAVLAIAVAVLLGPSLGFSNGPARFRTEMVGHLTAGFSLELMNTAPATLQAWVSARDSLSAAVVPQGLAHLSGIGCRTFAWKGRPVGLICFAEGGRTVHLFVVNRAALPDPSIAAAPVFSEVSGWMTATWTEGELVYVLARRGDEAGLKRLLARKA